MCGACCEGLRLCLHKTFIVPSPNFSYLSWWSMCLCRQWQTLSHFISCKHTRATSSNVFYHLSSVNPTGHKDYACVLCFFFFIPYHTIIRLRKAKGSGQMNRSFAQLGCNQLIRCVNQSKNGVVKHLQSNFKIFMNDYKG